MKKDEHSSKKINARVMKWREMLKNGLYADKQLLVRRIRKGIPESIRQQMWPELIKLDKVKEKTPLTYSVILLKDSYDTYDINLDIPRTFSFESQQVLRTSLFNVLKSLSIEFPLIGYCQGMNFLSMRLLEVLNDETVFYLLVFVIRKYKTFYDNFRNPGFVNKMNEVFAVILEKYLPKVSKKLKSQDIEPVMYTTSWFLTLFSKVLEREKFYRFFECLLVEGYVVVYKTALALMKLKEKQILENSLQENLPFVTEFEFYDKFTDDEFMKTVFSFEFQLDDILKLEQDYNNRSKGNIKKLQQCVQTAYLKKKQQPRNLIEWNLEDFKKSQFHYVSFDY